MTTSQNTMPSDFIFFKCECKTIKEFLVTGINIIRNIEFPNEGKLLNAMFSLSQGYERFLKVVYAQMFQQLNKRYPTNDEFKKLGHNINGIFDEVIKEAKQLNVSNEYLTKIENKEEPYNSILNILSDFASMLRYHNFAMLSSNQITSNSPTSRWYNEVEKKILIDKNIYLDKEHIKKLEDFDNQDCSIYLFFDYNNNRINNSKDCYILSQQQKVVAKYTKMYLCHIVKAIYEILNEMQYGCMLNELFWCFIADDATLKKLKTLVPA